MLLSVCIPVRNNINLFRLSLLTAAESIKGFEDKVEIVIGDNASEDDLESFINNMKYKYPKLNIIFSRNLVNIGLAKNFLNVVKHAKGKFVWIIGSDDFIFPDSIERIINIIESQVEIQFIGLNFANIEISKIDLNIVDSLNSNIFNEFSEFISFNKFATKMANEIYVDDLVDPSLNSVMLGSMMASIFERRIWNQLDFNLFRVEETFENLESIYPHIVVFANKFISRKAVYIFEPTILVGDGARSWGGDSLDNGSLLFIYTVIFTEIVKLYKKNGIKKRILKKCNQYSSFTAGYYLPIVVIRKHVSKNTDEYLNKIKILRVVKNNFFYFSFYKGICRFLVKKIIG